jgi:hypothetical protein
MMEVNDLLTQTVQDANSTSVVEEVTSGAEQLCIPLRRPMK